MKRGTGIAVSLVLLVVLLAIGFAAFTGFVAYSGMHDFKLPDAFERPPREDAARLGAVLETGLNWALRVCGAVVTILGASLAVRGGSVQEVLGSVVVILAGAVLITQHWAAGIALGVVGVAIVIGLALNRPLSKDRAEPL
jgi:hypothetical protein